MAVDLKDPRLREYLSQETGKKEKKSHPAKPPPSGADSGKSQRRLFKKTRAGVVLTRDEVKAIKAGRRKLRREMRQRGLKSRREFDLTAATLGLYFDKNRSLLPWLLSHWLPALLALLALLLAVLFQFAGVTRARGLFTINLSDGMFREGFTLSETSGFEYPSTQLFAEPAVDVPCVSISQIPLDIDQVDGQHNASYFAYTFYLRNEGDSTVSYDWSLELASESKNVGDAMWIMVFENGVMRFYARPNGGTGAAEALPAFGDDSRGYLTLPVRELAPDSDQFQLVRTVGELAYYRVVPDPYLSDTLIAIGGRSGVGEMEVNKYTVVIWLEGDDPDATDDLIGGHGGVEMKFRLLSEEDGDTGGQQGFSDHWKSWWDDLKFWQD